MGLKKGMTNNPAGRTKGTKNKTSEELRGAVLQFVNDNWDNVQEDFDKLDPKDRLTFFEKILGYSLPKLQAQTIDMRIEEIEKERKRVADLFPSELD